MPCDSLHWIGSQSTANGDQLDRGLGRANGSPAPEFGDALFKERALMITSEIANP